MLKHCRHCDKPFNRPPSDERVYCSPECKAMWCREQRQHRFWAKVQKGTPSDCWLWTACTDNGGYGQFYNMHAHRWAWVFTYGPIADRALLVCHTCDNRLCCNPAHLWLGTPRDNMVDMMAKGRWRFAATRIYAHGQDIHNAKLTDRQVRAIRRERAAGATLKALGAKYGVHWSTIARAQHGATWGHLA